MYSINQWRVFFLRINNAGIIVLEIIQRALIHCHNVCVYGIRPK